MFGSLPDYTRAESDWRYCTSFRGIDGEYEQFSIPDAYEMLANDAAGATKQRLVPAARIANFIDAYIVSKHAGLPWEPFN